MLFGDGEGTGSAEHHQVKQRVSAQPVSAVDTGASRLAAGIQPRNYLVLSLCMGYHLLGEKEESCVTLSGK